MVKPIAIIFLFLSLTAICLAPIEPCIASEGTWVTKASMNEARSALGVAVANGKIYAIGGSNRLYSYIAEHAGQLYLVNQRDARNLHDDKYIAN